MTFGITQRSGMKTYQYDSPESLSVTIDERQSPVHLWPQVSCLDLRHNSKHFCQHDPPSRRGNPLLHQIALPLLVDKDCSTLCMSYPKKPRISLSDLKQFSFRIQSSVFYLRDANKVLVNHNTIPDSSCMTKNNMVLPAMKNLLVDV